MGPGLTKEENEMCMQEGLRIVGELRKKYSNNNIRYLDIVLNSLCYALIRLTKLNVVKYDYSKFAAIIHHIIERNLVGKPVPTIRRGDLDEKESD